MFSKVASAQALLRKLYEKQAGATLPLVVGAGIVGSAHVARNAKDKAQEYKAGFIPGFNPHGGHQ